MKLSAADLANAMFTARGQQEGMTEEEIKQTITENASVANEFEDYLLDAELMLDWIEANEPEARALAGLILSQPPSIPEFNEELIIDELAKTKEAE